MSLRPPRGGRAGARGFTLVELMVALALAAMISVSIMFISSQARLAYEATVKKVDVIGQFRYVFRQLEEDFRNWIPTAELEFFTDGRGQRGRANKHWDPGEEVPDRRDELGPGIVDGGTVGEYDEFPYIIERQYESREPLQAEPKLHDAFQVYFRTRVLIDGAVREANVEYMLVDPSKVDLSNGGAIPPPPTTVEPENVADLALFKIVRYFDVRWELINTPNATPIVRKVVEVCSNVTDFTVEYLLEGHRVEPGFRSPKTEHESYEEIVGRPTFDPGLGVSGGYKKIFGYGSMKVDVSFPRAIAVPGIRADDGLNGVPDPHPVRFGFLNPTAISFAQLVPGDKIFVFTDLYRSQGAAGAQSGGSSGTQNQFPSDDYTVQANINGLLEFEEDIDPSSWDGTQSNILYKASYLPPAIRITLRVVDANGMNPKTMQREIWLRRRSR